MNITIFKDIRTTSTGFIRDVSVVFDRIRNGNSKERVELIRAGNKDLKGDLPSICFSGEFKNRNDKSIIKHSGLICLDFDKFDSAEILNEWKDKLTKDNYTFALFISPSGNGLKVIVRIPPEIEHHKEYFEALADYYDCQNFDRATSNISRVCYESYDPEIYINYLSDVWEKRAIQETKEIGTYTPVIPVTNQSQIVENLFTWFNKHYSMSNGQRNNNCYILASAFNDFGVSKLEAERLLLQYATKDFSQREIEQVVKSAYSNTSSHGKKYFEDKHAGDKIEKMIVAGKSEKDIISELTDHSKEVVAATIDAKKDKVFSEVFWEISKRGAVSIVHHKFKKFLEDNHFAKYYPALGGEFLFVNTNENLLWATSKDQIKDYVLNYLEHKEDAGYLPFDHMAAATKYFKDDYLSFIDTKEINLKEDTDTTCYLYFRNAVVEVTKDNTKTIDYMDLDGYVWGNHVINRDFKECDPTGSIYEKFISKVAGGDQDRFLSLCSVIGYLLHSYKGSGNNKAIIINDEVISNNPNGGSGKGIFCNALGYMKRVATLDGKQFDFNKSFAYQTVGADTQLLVFDDVKRNFAFENLFSLITEGITLEQKRKDAIKIPVSKSPKIIITTNYTITGTGGSFERRKFEVEFSSYFGVNHTPIDEFGHMLFDDWNSEEWQRFDNFMIGCVQLFLRNGLIRTNYHNLETRKFISETSMEFWEWCEDGHIEYGSRVSPSELYGKFVDEYPDFRGRLTQRRFSMWLEKLATFKGMKYETGKSNGVKWVAYGENVPEDKEVF